MPTPMGPPSGGNDPVRAAAMQNLRGGMAPNAAGPTQAPAMGGGATPVQGQGNEVAMHLAAAFEALLRTGPTPQNLAALEGFMRSLQQLAPNSPAPQAPLGQAPGTSPLPAPPSPAGMAGPSPMVPPRQV